MQYTTGLNHFKYAIVTEIENPLIMNNIELKALEDFPYVEPGDDLAKIILKSFRKNNINLDDGDVVAHETVAIPDNVTEPVTVLPTPTGFSKNESTGPFNSRSVGRPL